MAVQPLTIEPEAGPPPRDTFISRQAVVDREMRVSGYRLSYAAAAPGDAAFAGRPLEVPEASATRLLGDVLSVAGLEDLVGTSVAHLPVTRELLLTLGVPPVRPDRVMLRVPYETAVDPKLRDILDDLAGRGYALALYELPKPRFDPGLLDLFGTVEVDMASWKPRDAAKALKSILSGRATPLAVGLADYEDYEAAKELPFQLFSGQFFATPEVRVVRDVPVAGMHTLVSLVRLQGEGASIEELERVIEHDVGLSVKLLRYINSAHFGVRSKITSVRQAMMMLGARGVSRWALMIALAGGPRTPRGVAVTALTRARMCELLGMSRGDVTPDELFTVGLLSVADALLDRSLGAIVSELPLADHLAAALLRREGPAGAILQAVIDYEVADVESDAAPAGHRTAVGMAYMDALHWAQGSLQAGA
jgi:EAL and modified HD-GYP domain-containing signal transduction protein